MTYQHYRSIEFQRTSQHSIPIRHGVLRLIAACMLLGYLSSANAEEIKTLQPEDITRHITETRTIPAKTIFIEVEDPDEAAKLMSDSHITQAKQGWKVFDISPYQKNEDFRGMFITYVKTGAND